jgi:uncharacterized protein YjbJ (UPF0337 family)
MWNKDEIKGKGKQISGAIKDKTGELIKDPELEAKGEAEHIAPGNFRRRAAKRAGKPVKRYKRSVRQLPANFSSGVTRLTYHIGRRQREKFFIASLQPRNEQQI